MALLNVRPGRVYVDGTVGLGGHARAILEASAPDGRLVGVDGDGEALIEAREALGRYGDRVHFFHDNFSRIPDRLRELGIGSVDGLLLDLGVSTFQLDRAERGFSFMRPGPLDMRMNREMPRTAADLVRTIGEKELFALIRDLGEERWARRIARAIVLERTRAPIDTTQALEQVIWKAVPASSRHGRIHPATRTFQAIRIAVNDEIGSLRSALERLPDILAPGGRLCVISFHSLEDRMVKHEFQRRCREGGFRMPVRKPVRPSEEEISRNQRSRSAKLRALEREAA